MILRSLRLENFRNHAETLAAFADGCNVLTGNNGEGKTNVLEAISVGALTKSFYASHDANAVRTDTTGFSVQAQCVAETEVQYNLLMTYALAESAKKILLNRAAVHPLSSMVGLIPIVVLSPENNGITFGAPAERRRFFDLLLSQASKSYLADASEYRQVLRQRNKILLEAKITKSDPSRVLEPWDEQLCRYAARIIGKRAEAIEQLKPVAAMAYERIAGTDEHPRMEYQTSVEGFDIGDTPRLEEALRERLETTRNEERRLGSSLVGPHRDDVAFYVNNLDLRGFASQGQHKTFLVALKLAEFEFLKEHCQETPLLLLDDVFSELDEVRSNRLLGVVSNIGQTFITATDGRAFPEGFFHHESNAHFLVKQGTVARAAQTEHAH